MPVFFYYNEQDNLTLPIDWVRNEEVADWVEERLLEFLDTYLRIDAGSDGLVEEAVTDPVCGMQILLSSAIANDSYYGHPYFFCSKECLAEFQEDPAQYAQVKTM